MRTHRHLTLATIVLFAVAFIGSPYAAAAAHAPTQTAAPAKALSIPVTGTGGGGSFIGTFELQKFVTRGGEVLASGILTGTVSTATGVLGTVVRTILLPVTVGEATCEILHLDLGPLTLDLLGLQIDLSRIVLDITAEAGAGNLLGNLLCAVTNLLNDPTGLTRLLNSILDLLR
jgi:hypothetical protein